MKISYNWLKQFLSIDWEAERTGELLTNLGLEIEGIETLTSVLGGLEGILVGEVVDCKPHPNADRLKITKVNIGSDSLLQIVCGAPNVAKGQKVPVAMIGTTLYDVDGKPWEIKKGKIRGEASEGMICAEDELGLGTNHDGIMVLDPKHIPGTPIKEIIEIENDQVFEIGLTPNRADAMSHLGVARDLRAGLLQQGENIEFITPSTSSFHVENRSLKIDVVVANSSLAPRYCGLTISKLKITDSPSWLKNRLTSVGLTPINNVVDVTNYVLHELGQPLHAFDTTKIIGNQIHVKTVAAGTKFTTLDGVVRELHEEDLMICNASSPMCIAGVYGGEASGVNNKTTSIFLESAYFDPISIRKTAKRHGLNTDASFRFERGIDPNITEYALMRAAILISEIAGGEVSSDIIDIYPKKILDHQVVLNFDYATRLIGEEIPKQTIKKILTSLDIKVNNVTESGIGMTIPAYKNEVTREVDVVEEILRVYGYNNIEFSEKFKTSIASNLPVEDHQIQNKIANQLVALGFHETLCNSLSSPKYIKLHPALQEEHSIKMLNPLSADLAVLRQSMLFGNLESLAYNNNRKISNIRMFEFGKTYHRYATGISERKHLTLIICGNKEDDSWTGESGKTNFFYLKGVVSAMMDRLGLGDYSEKSAQQDIYSEGLELISNKNTLVSLGVIKKKISKAFDIENEVLYADFNWDAILEEIPTKATLVKPIPKYPKVKRDFALLLKDSVSFDGLKEAALQAERNYIKEITLFDVYTGNKLPKGMKSYAMSFTLQDENKTLTDKQIDKIMKKLQERFENDFGATLR